MFLSARHIDVKLNQDYAGFFSGDDYSGLIVCDGIGEFKDSAIVAKTVAELFVKDKLFSAFKIIHSQKIQNLKDQGIIGGTTLISALCETKNNTVKIQYLGNGGVVHFRGDFSVNSNSSIPYRYSDIMIPHISPSGSLTKHISYNSGKQELSATEIRLKLTSQVGDILLFFSDGINSIENNFIVKDNEKRFWRYESDSIQFIIEELREFLIKVDYDSCFKTQLIAFNDEVLGKLKSSNRLEDDASLGIILTKQVFSYFKNRSDG